MKMNNIESTLSFLCALGILLFLACTTSSVTGGASGTEVSACTGTVIDVNGNPIAHALVRLRPATFLSDSVKSESYKATHSIIDTFTGDNGVYGFTNLIPDSYSVEVNYNDTANDDTLGSQIDLRIEYNDSLREMYPIIMVPLARVSGKVRIEYGEDALVYIQMYGLDRSVNIDSEGNFSIQVPRGEQQLHIAAYKSNDSTRSHEFDGIDLSLNVVAGEQREAGSFTLRSTTPSQCKDGSCDSLVVRTLLDASGYDTVPLSAVVTTNESGRITALTCRNMNFSTGISEDIVRLSELHQLDLSMTGLPAMFHDIGRLMRLEVVRLGGNKLPVFSSSIGSLKNLRELDLSNNEFNDLPSTIMNCTSLSNLNVSGNRLCSLEMNIAQWLDNHDNAWRSDQKCSR